MNPVKIYYISIVDTSKTKSKPNSSQPKNEPTSITNENFRFPDKSIKEPLDSEKLLQSPIETHFANTPVSEGSHSPANGFTSQDCSEILCQELDKLDKEQILSVQTDAQKPTELKLDMVTIESIMSPTEENISMFTITKEEPKEKKEEVEECAAQVFWLFVCVWFNFC